MTTTERLRSLLDKRNEADKAWSADPHNQHAHVKYNIATAVLEREAINAMPALLAVVDAVRQATEDWEVDDHGDSFIDDRGLTLLEEALANLDQETP